ncbi:MAG: BrnT family toxin [Deltaproteobacteria bacterium]|nr:BrnT family toxin [Deltaproteobacteria bacterium]
MVISEILWLDEIVAKLERKHGVSIEEVEDALLRTPLVRRLEPGHVAGEDLYAALGRTTAGRYLTILFIRKKGNRALIISARDMDRKERRLYGRK